MLRQVATSVLLATLVLTAPARTRPHYGGTFHVETEGDPWQHHDGIARRLVFDGLTALDSEGTLRPGLAVEWESDNGNHRWQFRLRPGVHFHDGSPLTAVGVVASLTAACSAHCPWSGIHAIGSSVVFTSDSPMPNLPALLAGPDFLISLTLTADGKAPNSAIGTGPFQFSGFTNGVLAFVANDSCWQGRPFADAVEVRVHRNVRDQWFDLSVGRADVVDVPAEQLRQARQQRLTVVASPAVELLALQVADSGALSNPNLRKALALAIDRAALSNVIFQKEGQVTASPLPQSLTGYSFLFSVDRDLPKAHQLRGGLAVPMLTLSAEGNGAIQLAAQRIALNLREAGFNVQLAGAGAQHSDLIVRKLSLEGSSPAAVLEGLLRSVGQPAGIVDQSPAALYKAERDLVDRKTLIPLLDLPRAYAISGRVRHVQLRADGTLDLAATSIEAAP